MFGKIAEKPTSRSNQQNGNKTFNNFQDREIVKNLPPKSMKNRRKSTPNRVKIETKSVKRSRESLQDDLGGARGAIFRLSRQHEAPTWTPKFTKNH